jgi:hypothetical protein
MYKLVYRIIYTTTERGCWIIKPLASLVVKVQAAPFWRAGLRFDLRGKKRVIGIPRIRARKVASSDLTVPLSGRMGPALIRFKDLRDSVIASA